MQERLDLLFHPMEYPPQVIVIIERNLRRAAAFMEDRELGYDPGQFGVCREWMDAGGKGKAAQRSVGSVTEHEHE